MKPKELLLEFKPSLVFLAKFLGIYLAANLLYGFYVESYGKLPDPTTVSVTQQSAFILDLLGSDVTSSINPEKPTVFVSTPERKVLSVYEGCNGLNSMILFVAFILAFKGQKRQMVWYIPAGLVFIHLANLFRLVLLFYVSEMMPKMLYFTHKYLFTAIIYIAIFLLWYLWVVRYNGITTYQETPPGE